MGRFAIAALVVASLALARLAAAQANDDCANATVIGSLPFSDAVDTTAATTEAGDPVINCVNFGGPGTQQTRSVWYRYTSPAGGSLELDALGSDYPTNLTAWRGTCGAFGNPAACDDSPFESPLDDWSRTIVTLAAGETIYLEVTSFVAAGGNLVFNVKETPNFQVTDDEVYKAQLADVAAAADGSFLVVWEQDSETVMARRYCATGAPLGAAIHISGTPAFAELRPKVARAGDHFVVAWYDGDIQARRVSTSGAPIGATFAVGSGYPTYYEFDLGADGSGDFIVTWADFGSDGDDNGILARRFGAAGVPLAPAFAVNASTAGPQTDPQVVLQPGGSAVIAWQSGDGNDREIFGQRFIGLGSGDGEFQVNVTTTYAQWNPAIAADGVGDFVVVWEDLSQDCGEGGCVVGRRFDKFTVPQGGEFVVSSPGTGPPSYYVAIDTDRNASGDFVVAWANESLYPFARAFEADATPLGAAFRVSHADDDYQRNVRTAINDDGSFVVVWDWAPSGSHYRILGRAEAQNTTCPQLTGCSPAPRTGCKQPTLAGKGKLTLKDKDPDTHDAVVWKWVKGEATSVPEIGDALATDTYTLCLYDGTDTLVVEKIVPPGGDCNTIPCWTDISGGGFRYADKTGDSGEVRKMVLKSGDEGKAKVTLKMQGGRFGVPSLPPALPLRAQLTSTTGTCWEAEFRADGVTTSSPTVFAAKPHVGP